MLGEHSIPIVDIAGTLDNFLQSSLWQRTLNRYEDGDMIKRLFNSFLTQRATFIWSSTTPSQRKGYFLAGIGLESGQLLDAISEEANLLLVNANIFILTNQDENAIRTIIQLAELIFIIPPFKPLSLPDDWKEILERWLLGESLTDGSPDHLNEALQFIEDGLVYRLPWGLEAIRVRAEANGDIIADNQTIDDYETGLVVPAIENGTLNRSTAMLMQAGFNSRQAAIKAVNSTNASFKNSREFIAWLNSDEVFDRAIAFDWPTPETSELWWKFFEEYQPSINRTWSVKESTLQVDWEIFPIPASGSILKLYTSEKSSTLVLDSNGQSLAKLDGSYQKLTSGICYAHTTENLGELKVTYWGA